MVEPPLLEPPVVVEECVFDCPPLEAPQAAAATPRIAMIAIGAIRRRILDRPFGSRFIILRRPFSQKRTNVHTVGAMGRIAEMLFM